MYLDLGLPMDLEYDILLCGEQGAPYREQAVEILQSIPCSYSHSQVINDLIAMEKVSLLDIKWFNAIMNNIIKFTPSQNTGLYLNCLIIVVSFLLFKNNKRMEAT